MSVVTSIILTTFLDEDEAIAFINTKLGLELKDAESHGGSAGNKYMQIGVYLAAFNHWQPGAFMAVLGMAPWKYPEQVQLFVNGEHSDRVVAVECPLDNPGGYEAVLAAVNRHD